ncbi:MAG: hypothetical protein ACK4P3_00925, partial [Fimbriimonadaceae bacterium]
MKRAATGDKAAVTKIRDKARIGLNIPLKAGRKYSLSQTRFGVGDNTVLYAFEPESTAQRGPMGRLVSFLWREVVGFFLRPRFRQSPFFPMKKTFAILGAGMQGTAAAYDLVKF